MLSQSSESEAGLSNADSEEVGWNHVIERPDVLLRSLNFALN